MADTPDADILVVGAGILGVTIAYWLSTVYSCTIALADSAASAGAHTSTRNTGVVHRPFYLDPAEKRVFARASLLSYPMWKTLAKGAGLPWNPVGTINVAVDEQEVQTLERYHAWGTENGMDEEELALLDEREVRTREPEVKCKAGLLSKTDVSVDFGAFTRHICRVLVSRGVRFLGGHKVLSIMRRRGNSEVMFRTNAGRSSISCKFLVNVAGGGALAIAHELGFAREYAVLNFRGEYWVVDEPFASRVTSNIYRPPRFPRYPFLDPHFVVRADGSRQIGPNAVVVPGPYVYSGVGLASLHSFLDRPVEPKAKLLVNREFISLLMGEWRSSLSKRAMCNRVRRFVPMLDTGMLRRRGIFGVRSSIVDDSGFVPEALIFKGEDSAHVINFNSPGATGAPAFSAMVVNDLLLGGRLDGLKPNRNPAGFPGWDFQSLTGKL